jgi:nicotinamide-nucleotide amidase
MAEGHVEAAELFSIGTELTLGRIQDSNSFWMAGKLAELGVTTKRITVLPDDLDDIVGTLAAAIERGTGLIVITGGLGPTPDEQPVEALCGLAGCSASPRDEILDDYMRRRGVSRHELSEGLVKMASAPLTATVTPNPAGWAPCIRMDFGKTAVYALPGPPMEMQAVFDAYVAPFVQGSVSGRSLCARLSVEMFESEVSPLMQDVMRLSEGVYLKAYVALRNGAEHGLPVDIVARGASELEARERLDRALLLFTGMVRAQGRDVAPVS